MIIEEITRHEQDDPETIHKSAAELGELKLFHRPIEVLEELLHLHLDLVTDLQFV